MSSNGGTVSLSLRLVSETSTVIVGEDAEGDRRKFLKSDLKSCIVSRKLESVSVVIDRAKLRRVKLEKADMNPMSERGVKKVKRKCLMCRHSFHTHPSTFVCTPCKKTSNWRTGGDFSMAG